MTLLHESLLLFGLTALARSSADGAMVKPEYIREGYTNDHDMMLQHDDALIGNDQTTSYVFLQRFPLQGSPFFHTEVVVCPRASFDGTDQTTLDGHVAAIKDDGFVEIEQAWWQDKTNPCVELGYGGALCMRQCCAVPHGKDQKETYALNTRRAVISNADLTKKELFLYGTGPFSGEVAYRTVCGAKTCHSNWKGTDYRVLKNNCNTFTSTVLSCVYGLSEKKPHLGVSDLVTVQCHCPPPSGEDDKKEVTVE